MSCRWSQMLKSSLEANASLPYAKYVQLATVKRDGRPSNRTVVFRGFMRGDETALTFVTDRRSKKVEEVKFSPYVEVCWYLPVTREQFRLSGKLRIVDSNSKEEEWIAARRRAWEAMSVQGKSQFAWPPPREPRANDEAFSKAVASEEPEPAFCLVILSVDSCDYVQLFDNKREIFEREKEGNVWNQQSVNP